MKRNKELFFEYKNNKANLKKFLKEPVSFSQFIEVISELKNINLSSLFIESFYKKYKNDIFINITSKDPNQYSKYFWNSDCLGLSYPTSSDDFYISRGWNKDQIKELRKSKYATGTIEFQINQLGLSKSDATSKLNKRQAAIKSKRKETYKEYLNEDPDYFKKKCGYSIDHFLDKGFSKEDAEIKSKESALKVSTKNKQWAQDKKVSDPIYWNSRIETQLQYWIDKCNGNIEEAKILLKDRQTTFSLEKCIKKYGLDEGTIIWKKRNIEWSEKIEAKYKNGEFDKMPKKFNSSMHSKNSIELIDSIIEKLNLQLTNIKCYKNKELVIRDNRMLIKSFDFTYLPTKRIIEFNGDYWHCNPEIYESTYYHKTKKMTAAHIWEYDKEKTKLAESLGYQILHIAELDYKRDPETILKKCIEFLIT